MAREPNPKLNKALLLYKKGFKLIDIAKELDVKEGTVRSWKNRYEWDNATLQKKRNVAKEKRNVNKNKKESIVDEVNEVLDNGELTDKQRLFCIYYDRCFNATKAYQKAYGVDYNTAASISYRMMENDGVKKEIQRLKKVKLNRVMLTEEDVFQKYIDIAFCDITDYLIFRQEEVAVMGPFGPIVDKQTKESITKTVNIVRFKESSEIDGTLLTEVKSGKDGASIKLLDKMKALDFLAKHSGLLDNLTLEKLEIEKQKLELAKVKSGAYEEEEEVEDDGFIEALGNKVSEVWNEEDS